ncbi:MAG TPA: ZIP family metal transporter [Patescibacteria group bacterium]|nr:ZIP family metal transporter [Patescibacteria group bacterium]
MILLVIVIIILSILLGGLFAIRFRDKLHLILGFSAGAVIGVAFFDLLPESIELATKDYSFNFVALFMAIGFSLYMILDRAFSLHVHQKDDCEKPSHRGKLGAATLSFHSFLDGFGIGMAFKVSPAVGWVVAAAVLSHSFSDGINSVSMILKNKGHRKEAISWLVLNALAPAVGIFMTLFITISESILGLILAIFTGLFFYVGASDLIPESHHRHPTIWTTFMTILGMAVLYLVIHFAL